MSKKVGRYRKKTYKKKKWTDNCNDAEDLIEYIHSEVDRLYYVSKKGYITDEKIGLFEAFIVMNVALSLPGGTLLIWVGALYSNFITFISGIFIFLQGILVYAFFSVLSSLIRNRHRRKPTLKAK